MPTPSRTYQKASGVYYIRLLIPKHLISSATKPKFIYSLGTKDRHIAYVKALKINLDFEEWISKMSSNSNDRFPALIVDVGGAKIDYDLTIPAEKEAYYDMVANIGKFKPKSEPPPPPKYKLDEAFSEWKFDTYKVYCGATRDSYYPKVQLFISYAKTKKITAIEDVRKAFAKEYRDAMNVGETSPLTVDSHTKAIKQFFEHAIAAERYSFDNPFAKLNLIKNSMLSANTDSYIPFKEFELKRIFEYLSYAKRFKKPDLFFAPLIALTMGLRLEEVAQLRVTDIYDEKGIWVIDINDYGDDKELKTESSKRLLPIPIHLQNTNFLEYHSYIFEKFGENSHLFPYLIKTKNGYGKNIGYNFTQHKQEHIQVNEELKTFHSLRKNLGQAMDDKDYPPNLRKAILGHRIESDVTNDIYGSEKPQANSNKLFALGFMYSKLNALEYEIDFSQFQFEFSKDGAMEKLMRSKAKKDVRKELSAPKG